MLGTKLISQLLVFFESAYLSLHYIFTHMYDLHMGNLSYI